VNTRDDLDRRLAAWFAADAAAREPEHLLGQVLARTARTRRRPAWRVPERWIPMSVTTTHVAHGPRIPWRMVGLTTLLIVALVVGAVLISGSQTRKLPAPFGQAANGLIAYHAAGDILVADPVTGTVTTIVGGATSDSDPVWSLDGSQLSFVRDAGSGTGQLYAANADGTSQRLLTRDKLVGIRSHGFSPDGSRILFTYRNEG
jgi:hypothetical protein